MTLVFGRHAIFCNFRDFDPTPRKLGSQPESFPFWKPVGSEYFRLGVPVCFDMWRVPVLGCSWRWFLSLLLPTEDVAVTHTQLWGHLVPAQWSGLILVEHVISIYRHERIGCHPHFLPEITGILNGSCTSFTIQERYPRALSATFSLLLTKCTQLQEDFWHLLHQWRATLLTF